MFKTSKFPIILILFSLLTAGVIVFYKKNTAEKEQFSKEVFTKENISPNQEAGKFSASYYTDPDFGFKLSLDPEMSVSRFEEGEGMVLLLKNNSLTFAQVYVTQFNEPGPVTPERIKKDLPDKEVIEPSYIKINGEQALLFFSKDDSGLMVKEYWFVRNGYLYRATTEPTHENLVQKILSTWEYDK